MNPDRIKGVSKVYSCLCEDETKVLIKDQQGFAVCDMGLNQIAYAM